MKNILAAFGVLFLFGSLQRDKTNCPERIKNRFYYKGKFVGSDYVEYQKINAGTTYYLSGGRKIVADSIVYNISY